MSLSALPLSVAQGPGPRAQLEAELARRCRRRHAIFTGSGSSALYLALASTGSGPVLVPDICCYAPAAAAWFAEREIVPVEIDLGDFCLAPHRLPRLRGATVLGVHLYGHLCDGAALRSWARSCGADIIEDGAQAFGAGGELAPVGRLGLCSVLSFGHSKILDCGGGGALLCDDDALAQELRAREATLEELSAADAQRGFEGLRRDYYAHAPQGTRGWLWPLLIARRHLFLRRGDEATAAAVLDALPEVPSRGARRHTLWSRWNNGLDGVRGVHRPRPRRGSLPWRYSFLVGRGRQELLEALRGAGHHASAWYPQLSELLALEGEGARPAAERVAREVVNVWVDPDQVDEDRIDDALAWIRGRVG